MNTSSTPQFVVGAETIAVIAARIGPALPTAPVTRPTVHREHLGTAYLAMAMDVHSAAMALTESIGTAAL